MIGGEGSTYGKYFLIKRLAMGGMGEIFLAKLRGPVGFKKLLVVKRILPHHSANDQFVNMFFAEARIAAQLSHPHIVQIYEMGELCPGNEIDGLAVIEAPNTTLFVPGDWHVRIDEYDIYWLTRSRSE